MDLVSKELVNYEKLKGLVLDIDQNEILKDAQSFGLKVCTIEDLQKKHISMHI